MTPHIDDAPDQPKRGIPLFTPENLRTVFTQADENTLRQIAEDLAPYTWATLNARVYNDVRDDRKIRITASGADVTDTAAGVEVKLPGESYFDHLNFIGSVDVESRIRGRQANIRLGAGADCMFTRLVSSCWADEVAAGRGVEGQEMPTASGCTYNIYSTPFGASGAITAMNTAAATAAGLGAAADEVLFICGGVYVQTATQLVTPNTYSSFRIVGSHQQATTLRSNANSIIMFSIGAIQQGAVVTIEELCFDTTTNSNTLVTCIDFGSSSQASIHNNTFHIGSLNVGIKPGASAAECRIYDNVFDGGGAGIGTDTVGNHLTVMGNSFLSMDRGVVMSNNAQHTIIGNLFSGCTTGIEFSGNSASTDCIIANNRFNSCTKGINALTGTNIQYNTSIVGNNFVIDASEVGIDFSSMNASGLITTWQIGPNTFRATNSTAKGIIGDASFTINQITNNVFRNFTSGNEISGLAATTVAAHNISDAGAIADNGSPVGHQVFAGAGGFPHKIIDADGDTYVSTEESADSDVIESASAGTIRSRLSALGLQLANGTDLEMYSGAFSGLVASIDGATGHAGFGAAFGANNVITATRTFTDPAATVLGLNATITNAMTAGNSQETRGLGFTLGATGAFTASGIFSGVRALISAISASTVISDARGLESLATIVNAAGLIVNRYAAYLRTATGSGGVTNEYGLYIESMAKGATLNRAIYSAGGVSVHAGALAIGSTTAPVASALTEWTSTTQGLLIPRMTTTQQNAIGSPATGLLVYNTSLNVFKWYNGAAWITPYSIARLAFTPNAAVGAAVGDASSTNPQGFIIHSGPDGETAIKFHIDAEAVGTSLTGLVAYGDTNSLDTVASWTTIATLSITTSKSNSTSSMTNAAIPADRLIAFFVTAVSGTYTDLTASLQTKVPTQ